MQELQGNHVRFWCFCADRLLLKPLWWSKGILWSWGLVSEGEKTLELEGPEFKSLIPFLKSVWLLREKRNLLGKWIKQLLSIISTLSSQVKTIWGSQKMWKCKLPDTMTFYQQYFIIWNSTVEETKVNLQLSPCLLRRGFSCLFEGTRAEPQVKMFNQLLHPQWDKVIHGGGVFLRSMCFFTAGANNRASLQSSGFPPLFPRYFFINSTVISIWSF